MYQYGKLNKSVTIRGNINKSWVGPDINLYMHIISKQLKNQQAIEKIWVRSSN